MPILVKMVRIFDMSFCKLIIISTILSMSELLVDLTHREQRTESSSDAAVDYT